MAAYAPGPMEGDKEGCRDKTVVIAVTILLLALASILLLGCTCDSSKQPCDEDLSTRNQQRYNAPISSEWCVWGAELVPCEKGD